MVKQNALPASASQHSASCPQHSGCLQQPWRRRVFGTQQSRSERNGACRCTVTAVIALLSPPPLPAHTALLQYPTPPRTVPGSARPSHILEPAPLRAQAHRASHGQQLWAQLPGDDLGREPRAQRRVPGGRLPAAAADQRGGDPGGARPATAGPEPNHDAAAGVRCERRA